VRRATVKRLLGEAVSTEKIADILDRLEFRRVGGERDSVTVTVPSYRWDIAEEADLVEEVARIYGYENIGRAWKYRVTVPSKPDPLDRFIDRVSDHLVSRGHTEVLTSSFTAGREQRWFNWDESDPRARPVAIKNPLSANHGHLRTHLLPGVLEVMARNLARGRRELNVFAVGRVFLPAGEGGALPEEPVHLVIARTRPRGAGFWRGESGPVDLYDIKAEVESLLATYRSAAVAELVFDFEATRGPSAIRIAGGRWSRAASCPRRRRVSSTSSNRCGTRCWI